MGVYFSPPPLHAESRYNNAVNSATGKWRADQLWGTQSAECSLCVWLTRSFLAWLSSLANLGSVLGPDCGRNESRSFLLNKLHGIYAVITRKRNTLIASIQRISWLKHNIGNFVIIIMLIRRVMPVKVKHSGNYMLLRICWCVIVFDSNRKLAVLVLMLQYATLMQ